MDIVNVLEQLREGNLVEHLNAELGDLLLRLQETGKGGTLTLTLEVKPSGDGRVVISEKTSTKKPVPNALPTVFFVSDDGTLSRNNPRQKSLPY